MGFDVYCTRCKGNVSELIYKRDVVHKCPKCNATFLPGEQASARQIGCAVLSWPPAMFAIVFLQAALGGTDAAWGWGLAIGFVVFCLMAYLVRKYYYRWQ